MVGSASSGTVVRRRSESAPAGLRYARVDEVLALIKRANVTAMGIVGNERYRDF